MIPLPMIALHTGPVVICPRVRQLEYLLEGCGEIVSIEREENVIVLSYASGTMSTFLAFENTVIDWAIKHGLDPQTAKDYVAGLFLGLATEAMHTERDRLPELPYEYVCALVRGSVRAGGGVVCALVRVNVPIRIRRGRTDQGS